MFKKPEEILMAILALLWVGMNYYFAGIATAAALKYTFIITGSVLVWTVISFYLWRRDWIYRGLPVLVGLYVGCWTFWLDWFAEGKTAADGSSIWYTSIWFKLVLMVLPMIVWYAWSWKRARQRQLLGLK